MKNIIRFFARRQLVGNVIVFGIMLAAVILWPKIGKEQMPDLTINWLRITIAYPGASAEDVELSITKPIEEKLKGVTGLDETTSISSSGQSIFSIIFEPGVDNLPEKLQDVKDAIESVDLPRESEIPVYKQFKSSERAFIDVGVFIKGQEILDTEARYQLQERALAFKNNLLSLPEISGMETKGYLRPEIQIKVDPEKLKKYEVSLQQVIDQIRQQNVRTPIGSMTDKSETEITLISQLDDVGPLKEVIIESGFEGHGLKLKDIATVERGFEKKTSITKIQGHEGIIFNVQKSISSDILTAQAAIKSFIDNLKRKNPGSEISFILMDDESYEVRNRLNLISSNGIIGFILILVVLFLFLDLRAGVWVAIGIPFSLAATLIAAMLFGFTINNMTLAAVIIVLGIVVDDAIIVAENITRKREEGIPPEELAVERTHSVLMPILASMLTTCAAFIPLYFFSGRFGLFVVAIPTIVFFMLFASLIESSFILPGHMIHPLPGENFFKKMAGKFQIGEVRSKVIHFTESRYAKILQSILPYRTLILLMFVAFLGGSFYLFNTKMKYVMFPREEAESISVKAIGPKGMNREAMGKLVSKVENIFLEHSLGIVTSVRTSVGQSRRGGEVRENEAHLRIELIPPSDRELPLDEALKFWELKTIGLTEFKEVKFLKDRFGSESGSPVVIEVQENNDAIRAEVLLDLEKRLKELPYLADVEVERPITKNEYRLNVIEDKVSRMNISFDQLSTMLRAYIQGQVLYTLNSGEEEVDVRLMGPDEEKRSIENVLNLRVANKESYLVPVGSLVNAEAGKRPSNIQRTNFKRAIKVYADIKPESRMTPLDVAVKLENEIFPEISEGNSTTNFRFRGEIEDSRESQSDFSFSIILVLLLIYVLLIFLFDSLWTPFLIGAIIPFGVSGVIITLILHGMTQYGFFAVVGTLGLLGIVINDSIVLLDKLEEDFDMTGPLFEQISRITATRLRAVIVTTLTTAIGLLPTAYGWGGYDSMLAEMMIVMAWGLLFATLITLVLVPCLYSYLVNIRLILKRWL